MILLGYGLWHLGLYDELIELSEKIIEKAKKQNVEV